MTVHGDHEPEEEDEYRLKMRAEVGAESPFWTERGEMVFLEDLAFDDELRDRLNRWAENAAWEPNEASQILGKALLSEAQRQLPEPYELVWDND